MRNPFLKEEFMKTDTYQMLALTHTAEQTGWQAARQLTLF